MTNEERTRLGAIIRRDMESRGITGREMAKETGLTVQTVSHVLLGRHEPKKSTLRLIQRCLSKHPILSLMAEAMG